MISSDGITYIFNPEHDLCLANGDPNFVPPDSALSFGKDCEGLLRWIGCGELGRGAHAGILPWGWNAVLRKQLLRDGIDMSMLPSEMELDNIRNLSHRRIAAEALSFIRGEVTAPKELDDVDEIAETCAQYCDSVLKAPWSGSGKGIRWVHETLSESDAGWCRRTILRQGSVMVERRYDVVQEFAMLFYCDSNTVNFEGYSLFYTDNGIYHSNLLASDSEILRCLGQYVPTSDLDGIKTLLTDFLYSRFARRYSGFIGVDMFICRQPNTTHPSSHLLRHSIHPLPLSIEGHASSQSSPASFRQYIKPLPLSTKGESYEEASVYFIHPCVEINVRMTMGLLARRIYDYHLPQLLSDSPFVMPFCDGRYLMSVLYSSIAPLSLPQNTIPITRILPSSHYAVIISPK